MLVVWLARGRPMMTVTSYSRLPANAPTARSSYRWDVLRLKVSYRSTSKGTKSRAWAGTMNVFNTTQSMIFDGARLDFFLFPDHPTRVNKKNGCPNLSEAVRFV